MSRILALKAAVVIASFAFTGAASAGWVDGRGGSCQAACGAAGSTPVASGKYKNGQPFHVCAANAKGEGYRAGYNLEPNWSKACVVGYGGKEDFAKPYKCLCQTKPAG